MAVGDLVLFVCEYDECPNQGRIMKPSAAAYQRFCSRSCGAKNSWKTRPKKLKPEGVKKGRCSVEDCNKEIRSEGLCSTHYMRNIRHGDPTITLREAGSCPPDCKCNRHKSERGVRVSSLPCLSCKKVREVHPCIGPDGAKPRKFCNQECWRNWQKDQALARKSAGNAKAWDMSPKEFQERLVCQDNKCAICSKEIVGRDIQRDHCHKTGEWRGLLCNNCNRGLGHFMDDPDILMAAAFYLARGVDVLGFAISKK